MIVDLVRRELSKIRAKDKTPGFELIVDLVRGSIEHLRASRLQPVINGTGIVIHTNFGRAPLAPEAIRALSEIGPAYSNLEYDVVTGERGCRATYIENALALLCAAESATILNNCAAALVLIVWHFTTKGRAQSPGELLKSKSSSRGEMVKSAALSYR
jgi:L-seryl-tRNA(Ser) seleniumtransferase